MDRKQRSVADGSVPREAGVGVRLEDMSIASKTAEHFDSAPDPVLPSHLEVVECVDVRHPTLKGRVRVGQPGPSKGPLRWIPTLLRLPVRKGDHLLVAQADNWDEPIAIGVLDGFARRPPVPNAAAAALELKSDESLRVRAEDGTELLELAHDEDGPIVRMLQRDTRVELSGAFSLEAESISLRSRNGVVELESPDDVVVRGEVIRLN